MNQRRIPVPAQQLPNPADHICDFCDETATKLHEIKKGAKRIGSQMYAFSCPKHHRQVEDALTPLPRQRKI